MSKFVAMWEDDVAGMSGVDICRTLGGSIKNPPISNFCCVRVSHALISAGYPITIASDYKDKDGEKYIIKVETLKSYLRSKFGDPVKVTKDNVGKRSGIIIWTLHFSDATGHADIYNGRDGRGAKYKDYWDDVDNAELWVFPY